MDSVAYAYLIDYMYAQFRIRNVVFGCVGEGLCVVICIYGVYVCVYVYTEHSAVPVYMS
jgi:hypothetical protein